MKKFRLIAVAILATLLLSQSSRSADHIDSPGPTAEPTADITDVFAWMSPDARSVFLVMNLVRDAQPTQRFSDSVQYVFHITSRASFGAAAGPEVAVICAFDKAQTIQCWAGNEAYVTGDASNPNGITSGDGKLRVFAGLRNDPFFFNLAGFRETSRIVAGAVGSLQFDAAGCPTNAPSATLINQLRTAPGGVPPLNNFDRFNVIAIVIVLDKSVVTKNGPILSVWGSTNRP